LTLIVNGDIILPVKDYLYETAASFGIIINGKCLEKFEAYYQALIDWNRRVNLTSITEAKDVALKHFADSLTAEQFISSGTNLADVGSGAGFPGIPLKLFRPDIKITLMDSLNKRVAFLKEMIALLDLKDAEAMHVRAEDAGRGAFREQFDSAAARAVARLNVLCEYCLPLVKIGGVFIAYKTKDEQELNEAKKGIKILGGEIDRV